MTTYTRVTPTKEEAQIIDGLLTAKFPVTLGTFAKALQCTDLQAGLKLPAERATFVALPDGEAFDAFWAELATWKKVTLMILKDKHVFEIEGKLFTGKRAQGYYNILGKDATIGGHIAFDQIIGVLFTAFPFMGRDSYAVQFIGRDEQVSFAVYVGRENHQLIPEVVESWKATLAKWSA